MNAVSTCCKLLIEWNFKFILELKIVLQLNTNAIFLYLKLICMI
jgi:hypothetical protein